MGASVILGFVAVVASVVALVLGSVACALPYWQHGDVTLDGFDFYFNQGLWKVCAEGKIQNTNNVVLDTCDFDFSDISSGFNTRIKAMRGLTIVAIIFAGFAAIIGMSVISFLKKMKILLFVAGGLSILAGLCFLASVALFVEEIKVSELDLHYAFFLDVAAAVIALVAGGLFISGKLSDKGTLV